VGILIGLLLIIIGIAIAVFVGRRAQKHAQAVAEVPLYDATQVAQHGQDANGMRISVAGTAQSRPAGPLMAPISQRECAWYRLTISERVRETSRNSEGERTTSESERVVSQETSPDLLVLRDATGDVRVDPLDADVDNPLETFDRLESAPASNTQISFGSLNFSLGSNDGVIGIRKREEIIPVGSALYVLGGAYAREDGGLVAKPRQGPFIISTRSAQEVATSARRRVWLWIGIGAVVAFIGIAVFIGGLFG